jgi:hopanoid biosynthesis associated RND transporter like protein HpnN
MKIITATLVHLITLCTRRAWVVIGVSAVLTVLSVSYAVQHFAMTTDINKLISSDLPYRQREFAYEALFPQYDIIAVVVDAPTPEQVSQATAALYQKLSQHQDLFRSVSLPGGGEFFARNGLLFQSRDELKNTLDKLVPADPLIQVLASDPSLRGLTQTLSFGLMGAQGGHITLDDMTGPMTAAAETLEHVLAGEKASFSWRNLVAGRPAGPQELRQIIVVRPVLDYAALEPGRAASDAIRQAAVDLKLAETMQARVRLTGPVPMADEEFATIKENAVLNGLITILIVLFILWRALGSGRTILAVSINLVVGLALTAALGLMMVGALNLISIYFAVLFVGLGVDFGIQFSVRYRAERHRLPDLREALIDTGRYVAAPLTLAACATAAGFLSFLPTDYKGLSELGLIAGFGMLIAFGTSVTLLPALLWLFKPPGEPEALGYPILAPVDRFLDRHRIGILVVTFGLIIAGAPLLYWLRFDFNPLNLRSTKVESVATFLDLRNDPAGNVNAVEVLAPTLADAEKSAEKLRTVPSASRVITLNSFIPQDQKEKLPLIRNAAKELEQSLNPTESTAPPSDAENIAALNTTAQTLTRAAGNQTGTGAAAAKRLAGDLSALARAQPRLRTAAEEAFIPSLKTSLNDLRGLLSAQPVSLDTLPPDLRRQWMTPDGRARVEITPSGDPNDTEALRSFASAVLAIEPNAVAGPVSILESSRVIVRAFFEAGAWALISIMILLWITLRRFGDVLLTLIPLLLAGVVTLEISVLIDLPLNFANIIALPLLLGVGVAFKIYYIMAWREGQTNLLQSVLTRAVMFSAATTATAFGSLWLSSHPGTSSMGKLLALSLVCTLAAAALFQPILMGKPRTENDNKPA